MVGETVLRKVSTEAGDIRVNSHGNRLLIFLSVKLKALVFVKDLSKESRGTKKLFL